MIPLEVDTIAKPKPFLILGMLFALAYTLRPGFDTLLISFITGSPLFYFTSNDKLFLSFESDKILKSEM